MRAVSRLDPLRILSLEWPFKEGTSFSFQVTI
jgi:hypothetical protein